MSVAPAAVVTRVEGGLRVGAAGKDGELTIEVVRRAGTTRVSRLRQRAPLYVYAPVHLDPGRPDMAFIYLQQAGDGIVQGDRYIVDVRCRPDTALHLTTQSATNVYAAPTSRATQAVRLHADAGALLEYLPGPLIPFAGARLHQRTSLTIDPAAVAIIGETLLPGRVARGETHAYALVESVVEAHRPDGRELFTDVLRLAPGADADPRSLALLGAHDVLASLYAIAPSPAPERVVEVIRTALAAHPEVLAGASVLPDGCGACARIVGARSATVAAALHAAWDATRRCVVGIGAPDRRTG